MLSETSILSFGFLCLLLPAIGQRSAKDCFAYFVAMTQHWEEDISTRFPESRTYRTLYFGSLAYAVVTSANYR